MPKGNPRCSDEEFIELFDKFGAERTSRIIGSTERNVYARRRRLEGKYDKPLQAPTRTIPTSSNPARIELDIQSGVVLVGGDGHYWPGKAATAHRALVHFAKEMKPRALIYNGDAFDGSTISRPIAEWKREFASGWKRFENCGGKISSVPRSRL